MSDLLIPSFLVSDVSGSLRSLNKNERCDRIVQVTHQKWATLSDSLRSLTKNERPWANCLGCSPKMSEWVNCLSFWANRSFAHFFAKHKWFAQNTDEWIPSPVWNETVPLTTEYQALKWDSSFKDIISSPEMRQLQYYCTVQYVL